MKTIAFFPLELVKKSIQLAASGSFSDLGHDFGKKKIAVYCQIDDMKNTHCGSNPLIAVSWIKAIGRFNFARHCYIDCNGSQVWPA